MIWLWIAQFTINAALISLLFYWLRRLQNEQKVQVRREVGVYLHELERRLEFTDSEIREQRARVEDQLRNLSRICVRAEKLLRSMPPGMVAVESSTEATELISLGARKVKADDIPSLRRIEEVRDRISREGAIDLRTVLQGQLA